MHQLVADFADAIRAIDESREPFKTFQPGVGPYGEPQLVRKTLEVLRGRHLDRYQSALTKRVPDVLIPGAWALEFKIVRPFGDNGIEAEHWSQNLLHPYEGNVSAIGDALKLMRHDGPERKGLIVFSYEHAEPRIDIHLLLDAFEVIAKEVARIPLGPRHAAAVENLVHPVHQRARVFGWEIASPRPA